MAAARYDLTIHRGADFSRTLRILDVNENPVAVSGGSVAFRAQIREGHRKPLAVALTITALGDGEITFSLTDAETKTLDVTRPYKWDLFYTDTVGTVHKLLYGDVVVIPNITHLPA